MGKEERDRRKREKNKLWGRTRGTGRTSCGLEFRGEHGTTRTKEAADATATASSSSSSTTSWGATATTSASAASSTAARTVFVGSYSSPLCQNLVADVMRPSKEREREEERKGQRRTDDGRTAIVCDCLLQFVGLKALNRVEEITTSCGFRGRGECWGRGRCGRRWGRRWSGHCRCFFLSLFLLLKMEEVDDEKKTAIGVLILSTCFLSLSRFAIPFFSFVAFKRARKRESGGRKGTGEEKKEVEPERRFVCLTLLDLLLSVWHDKSGHVSHRQSVHPSVARFVDGQRRRGRRGEDDRVVVFLWSSRKNGQK